MGELQERISSLESDKSDKLTDINNLQDQVKEREETIIQIRKLNEEEITNLKQDLELKIRHEREKENSHKEFQKQSIEYEKKLQDQIEERNHQMDNLKSELESQKKDICTQKDYYEKDK